jgi:hypothetical protein
MKIPKCIGDYAWNPDSALSDLAAARKNASDPPQP